MKDSYAIHVLEKTLEGLRQSLVWEERLRIESENTYQQAAEKIEELSNKIAEVADDLNILRNR